MMYDNFTIETNEYKKAYWSQAMRGLAVPFDKMDKGSVGGNMYVLPRIICNVISKTSFVITGCNFLLKSR